jgi:hypothetical protein
MDGSPRLARREPVQTKRPNMKSFFIAMAAPAALTCSAHAAVTINAVKRFAYGANIGWLTFTNRAADGSPYDGPSVSLLTGRLDGFVWSEVGLGLIPPGAGATTTRNVAASADLYRFFLIEAIKPLQP